MTTPMDLAALVLLDAFRYVAVEFLVASIVIGAIPALMLLAILFKVESRKAVLRHGPIHM